MTPIGNCPWPGPLSATGNGELRPNEQAARAALVEAVKAAFGGVK